MGGTVCPALNSNVDVLLPGLQLGVGLTKKEGGPNPITPMFLPEEGSVRRHTQRKDEVRAREEQPPVS